MALSFLQKPIVKVCVHKDCCGRGSERVYEALRREHLSDIDLQKTDECFRFCKDGPNVAVSGAVLHRVSERSAVSRIRSELRHPSKKTDGVGTRSLNDLDDVLNDLIP